MTGTAQTAELLSLVVAAGVASCLLTGAVRRYAMAKSILDIPNPRSAHSAPTPRGGGLAIAASSLTAIALCGLLGWVSHRVVLGLVGGGVLVTAVGWLDDRRHAPAVVRIAAHLAATAWALYWLGGMSGIRIWEEGWALGWAGSLIALLGIVWAINLYNFMDGIDGIAGIEAISVGLIGSLLLVLGGQFGLAAIALVIAATSGGFLPWNWPPAKIFMGDAGSGLLGFLFGALAVASENAHALPLLGWMLLLEVFVFDATVTLFRRMIHGERWYEAHRSHAYQRAVQSGWSHARVCAGVGAINVALGLLAWLSWRQARTLMEALIVATFALAGLYHGIERRRPMQRAITSSSPR